MTFYIDFGIMLTMQERNLGVTQISEVVTNKNIPAPKNRGRLRLVPILAAVGLATFLTYGCAPQVAESTLQPKPDTNPVPAVEFIQDPAFLQCRDVNYMPKVNLLRDPLTMPNGPKNPQIQHAIDTLYGNGVYDLLDINLLPQGTMFRVGTITQYYCLPDLVSGKSRFFIQTDEGVGTGIPYGLVKTTLPEGLNPIIVTRNGQRYPGSDREKQEFLFLNLQAGQEATFENADGSYRSVIKGPLAIQTAGSFWRSMEFITPERGFADDKPIPQKP